MPKTLSKTIKTDKKKTKNSEETPDIMKRKEPKIKKSIVASKIKRASNFLWKKARKNKKQEKIE